MAILEPATREAPLAHYWHNPEAKYAKLFSANLMPAPSLLRLLKIVGFNDKGALSWEQINEWTQKNLLRNNERWDEQTNQFEALKEEIIPLFEELGFLKGALPSFALYQGAIVHGASLPTIRSRFHYLVEMWKAGVRFDTLYFLSGERPLNFSFEGEEMLLSDAQSPLKIRKGWQIPKIMPKTECEMAKIVWDQTEIPDDMRQSVSVFFIDAKMKREALPGMPSRPNTEDTVYEWLKTIPLEGRYLAVSNAPYILRQDAVMQKTAPLQYLIETIGYGWNGGTKMAIILDELARMIYQISLP